MLASEACQGCQSELNMSLEKKLAPIQPYRKIEIHMLAQTRNNFKSFDIAYEVALSPLLDSERSFTAYNMVRHPLNERT